MRLVEVLYFYLMPEVMSPKQTTSASNTAVLGGRGKELIAAFDRRRETVNGDESATVQNGGKTKTTEEKQYLLGKYLSNVSDFVEDLKEGPGLFQVGGM